MLEISNLRLPLDAGLSHGEDLVRRRIAKAIGCEPLRIVDMRLLKRSVDARKKNDVHFVATYAFSLTGADELDAARRGCKPPAHLKLHEPYAGYRPRRLRRRPAIHPVVVGTGPAGLFAAWALAKAGACPLVVERGECVDARLESVARFNGGGPLDPDSNIQFGEGGAGTFSDGKLTTNIKNQRCKDVLHIFAEAGAPEEILWQAKPHIGTDLLVDVVRRMREEIVAMGG
ncbi:NAD(P)-binding protein, partial [Slackia piriformis]|uniref:NAD(P)-binding protein n=1 Tax=Slackia piriformis TaxID=626934 RepID=UPI002F91D561